MTKKLEYSKENLRLLSNIIIVATSGSMFTKLMKDSGWTPETTSSKEWQISKKSKADYLFDEFIKIGDLGRLDILDFIVGRTIEKNQVYFKFKFPTQQYNFLKKKLGKIVTISKKNNLKMFNERKFHNSIVFASKMLFSDGYISQSIFEACKLFNKRVQELSSISIDGKALMLKVFSPRNPLIKLNKLLSQSEIDEQEGYMYLFAGLMQGVRNPKGHELESLKDPYRGLEYLSIISLFFRKLDESLKND